MSANERERRENKKKRKSRDVTCVCTVYYVQKKVELFSTWVDGVGRLLLLPPSLLRIVS